MTRLATFLLGVVVGLITAVAVFFGLAVGPVKSVLALAALRQAWTASPPDVASGSEWTLQDVTDAISHEHRWVLYTAADSLGFGGLFGFRCETAGDGTSTPLMVVKIAGFYSSGFGETADLVYRIGDGSQVHDTWRGIGDGVLMSQGDAAPGILTKLKDSDTIGFRVVDTSGQPHDLQLSARGARAKVPDFMRNCASLATATAG